MKRIGTSTLAVLFLLTACGEEHKHTSAIKQVEKKDTPTARTLDPNQPRKTATAEAQAQQDDDHAEAPKTLEDPNTVVARTHATRFYRALVATSEGQDTLKGDCGKARSFKRGRKNRQKIDLEMTFAACQVEEEVLLDGMLRVSGDRRGKQPDTVKIEGTLQFADDPNGACNIALHYPLEDFFAAIEASAQDADVGLLDPVKLTGKLCEADIAEVVHEAHQAEDHGEPEDGEAQTAPDLAEQAQSDTAAPQSGSDAAASPVRDAA